MFIFANVYVAITGLLAIFLTAVFAANHKAIFPAAAHADRDLKIGIVGSMLACVAARSRRSFPHQRWFLAIRSSFGPARSSRQMDSFSTVLRRSMPACSPENQSPSR